MKIEQTDYILVGAGIMSATLAVILHELEPSASIHIYERLDKVAEESSDGWNNAGTGHAGYCELNYTPENEDGSISISKAVKIAAQFETSKHFWAALCEKGYIKDPRNFISRIPHHSFVMGEEDTAYLRKRYDAMKAHHLFSEMEYSEEFETLKNWMPLMMQNREKSQVCAATMMSKGTDVNFGSLTEMMLSHLSATDTTNIFLSHEVRDLDKNDDGSWTITVKDLVSKTKTEVTAKFVFIGAGGGTLYLLNKSGIDEADGYGGFPISGQWLKCRNENIIQQHCAKVYGKASIGAPPMSVPHLDTRMIDGERQLLFGPYAGFSTKFLKQGSLLDLPRSIDWDNIFPLLSAGWHNLSLTKYLIGQVTQSMDQRMELLREYYPDASVDDWELETAGQRVQVIKKDEEDGGKLEFGTELVVSEDGTIAGLLGASPGASTATSIMIEVLEKCFREKIADPSFRKKITEVIPSYGSDLQNDAEAYKKFSNWCETVLGLRNNYS